MIDDMNPSGVAPEAVAAENPSPAKRSSARRKAEDHFAAAERRDTQVRKELEAERTAAMAKMAKLRALRLAKEAEEHAAAAAKPATTRAAKPRRIKV